MQPFGVLRKIAGPRLEDSRAASSGMLDFDAGANCIAVGPRAPQVERDGPAFSAPVIFKRTDLRTKTAFQQQIEIAVAIQIRNSEGPAVFREIDSGDSRVIVEMSIAAGV